MLHLCYEFNVYSILYLLYTLSLVGDCEKEIEFNEIKKKLNTNLNNLGFTQINFEH